MTHKIREGLLGLYAFEAAEHELEQVIIEYREFVKSQSRHSQIKEIRSMSNRIKRFNMWSCTQINLNPVPGDICYLDYGHAYKNEAGFQHFGLLMSIWNQKPLFVPMTSNIKSAKEAGNMVSDGKNHLYFIGKPEGLNKESTLFLNDAKRINSARVISINGHIKTDSDMFREIVEIMNSNTFM